MEYEAHRIRPSHTQKVDRFSIPPTLDVTYRAPNIRDILRIIVNLQPVRRTCHSTYFTKDVSAFHLKSCVSIKIFVTSFIILNQKCVSRLAEKII